MTIKQYKLMDYPCLYYLKGKVNDKTICKFLCGLGTIFGMDMSEVSSSSILFASTSKVLFNGKGFSIDEIKKYGASVFMKPFSECNKLNRWRILGNVDLPNNCCIFCPLSTTYKNARIDLERMNIRGIIYTGKLNNLESNRFYSVVSVSPNNDIGSYPLIPLLGMLNQYFVINENHGPYPDKDELIESFYKFVCDKLSYSDEKHKKAVYDCVKRELNLIYDFDLTTLNDTLITTLNFDLLSKYTYEAPKIMKPGSSSDVPEVTPAKKKQYKSSLNIDKQKPLLTNNNSDSSNNKKDNLIERTKNDIDKSSPAVLHNTSEPEPSDLYPVNMNNVIPDVANKGVLHCTDDNAKAILAFITDICSSRYVCIESVVLNKRHGLLLLTASSERFYFFDLEYAPPGYLYPALKDATKMKFFSLNPLPVIYMLYKLGFDNLRVESLCALYGLVNSVDRISSFESVFMAELSVCMDKSDEFYFYYMPLYEKLYSSLSDKIALNKDKSTMKKYIDGTRFDTVLGRNYDLSDILYNLSTSVSGYGFYNYAFNYNKYIPYIKAGISYIVMLDININENDITLNDLFETIAVQVNSIKLECVRYARLVAFIDKGIVYYSTMHGDTFFDILIDVVRKNLKIYNLPTPSLKTFRVEYK